MARRIYHDFVIYTDPEDIVLDERGRVVSYKVLVFDSPVGQSVKKEPVEPGQPLDVAAMVEPLQKRLWDQDPGAQMRFGEQLRGLILPGEAYRMFCESRSWLPKEDGLRLRLRLAPPLTLLPWEYLYDQPAGGEKKYNSFLALDPRISIVRHQAMPVRADWFDPVNEASNQERRVVIAMASPPPYQPLPGMDIEQEKLRIELESTPGVDPVFVPDYQTAPPGSSACLKDLRTALLPGADIFHFTGHGEFAKDMGPRPGSTQGKGQIVLAGEAGGIPVDGDTLCTLLQSHGIRLAVLDACETAQCDEFQAWASVASALLKGRIAAVVAMQSTIYHQLGRAFAATFYESLVKQCTLDEAVALGRTTMYEEAQRMNEEQGVEVRYARDWGAVQLHLRAEGGGPIFAEIENKVLRERAGQLSDLKGDLQVRWWEWSHDGRLVSREQLAEVETLAQKNPADASRLLYPGQALLLIRSAMEYGEWQVPWLGVLRQEGGKWVQCLDKTTTREEIRKLVGLENLERVEPPENVSPLAWTAVSAVSPAVRKTAALALAAAGGLEPLKQAIKGLPAGQRGRRKAELFGFLADADPELEQEAGREPPWDRLRTWWWRAWRRMREAQPLIWGGALGAALGLGLMRSLMPYSIMGTFALFFSEGAFFGAVLGLALAAGLILAGPLLLQRIPPVGSPVKRRTALLGVGLGSLFFGLAHLVVCMLSGADRAETIQLFLPGIGVGLGLALGQFGQPLPRRPGLLSVLLRLAVMLVPVLLVEIPVFLDPRWNAAVMIYSANKLTLFLNFTGLPASYPGLMPVLAMLDAALAGISMTLGMLAGFWRARVWMESRSPALRYPKGGENETPMGKREHPA